jgi:hypothetical protein
MVAPPTNTTCDARSPRRRATVASHTSLAVGTDDLLEQRCAHRALACAAAADRIDERHGLVGDFGYRGRDNIGTWLVGKVAQDRAIEKMRNLLGAYPNVSSRLASQPTGQFFVLGSNQAVEVRCDRAMMSTEQLPEMEIVELARATAS